MTPFTGYDPAREERSLLSRQCIDFDTRELIVQGDLPATRRIKELMRRDDQGQMNSCAGFGLTNSSEVTHFLRTGKWRQFNPLWSYRRGQEVSNIRGDNGATIHGVVTAAKRIGLFPEDVDGDGTPDWPYRVAYNMSFPTDAHSVAAKWRIGYSVELTTFDQQLRFLQANQGAIVVGGAWGNWRPDNRGICRSFRSGGGGHARARVDWITIDGEIMLVEANSHGTRYGDNGFSYMTRQFVDAEAAHQWTAIIGVSDLKTPEPRYVDWLAESPYMD